MKDYLNNLLKDPKKRKIIIFSVFGVISLSIVIMATVTLLLGRFAPTDEFAIIPELQCKVYGVNDLSGNDTYFFTIDISGDEIGSSEVQLIGQSYEGADIEGLEYEPSTGIFYATSGDSAGNGMEDGQLYVMTPAANDLEVVEVFEPFDNIKSLAFNSNNSTLYGWVEGDGLIKFSKTGSTFEGENIFDSAELVHSSNLKIEGLAWDGNDLYGIAGRELYKGSGEQLSTSVYYEFPSDIIENQSEALEFSSEGVLMIGTHKSEDLQILAFDVDSKEIIQTKNIDAITENGYELNDVESLVWPEICGNPFLTPTPTDVPEPSSTPDPTPTTEPTITVTPTGEPTPTTTPVPTNTPAPSVTPSPGPTSTPGPTPTVEPSLTPTPTDVPVPTATIIPNNTPLPTGTNVPTPVPTIPTCGQSCLLSVTNSCGSGYTCTDNGGSGQYGVCELSSCVSNPSQCEADKCTPLNAVNVSKTGSMACLTGGGFSITYQITIYNPSSSPRTFTVEDMLDTKLTSSDIDGSSISDNGSVSNGKIIWNNLTIAANTNKSLTYKVNKSSTEYGNYYNSVSVEESGIERGRASASINANCLPETSIDFGSNIAKVVFAFGILSLGFLFFKVGGPQYIGSMIPGGKENTKQEFESKFDND